MSISILILFTFQALKIGKIRLSERTSPYFGSLSNAIYFRTWETDKIYVKFKWNLTENVDKSPRRWYTYKKTGDSTMRINSLILNIKKHVCIIMPNELTSSYPNLFSVWGGYYSDYNIRCKQRRLTPLFFYRERKRSKKHLHNASAFYCKRLFTLYCNI